MIFGSIAKLSISDSLKLVYPPQCVTHVGTGNGDGPMHEWQKWGVPYATLIDGDTSCLVWAKQLASGNPGWQVCPVIIAEKTGVSEFHYASNPNENGLLLPEKLSQLWPNLHTLKKVECSTTTLDGLLDSQIPLLSKLTHWLIVDCLPTMPILSGAQKFLQSCSVLWLRVFMRQLHADGDGEAESLHSIASHLQALGFVQVYATESNHPSIGEVFFVRNWQATLLPITIALQAEKESLDRELLASNNEKITLNNRFEQQVAAANKNDETSKVLQLERSVWEVEKSHFVERVATLELSLHSLMEKEQQVSDRVRNLTAEQAQQTERATKAEEKCANLSQENASSQAQIQELRAKISASEQREACNKDEIVKQQTENTRLSHLAGEAEEKIAFISQKNVHLEEQVRSLETQVAAANTVESLLRDELASLSSVRDQLSEVERQGLDTRNNFATLQDLHLALQQKYESEHQFSQQLQNDLSQSQQDRTQLQARVSTVEQKETETKNQLTLLQEHHLAMQQKYDVENQLCQRLQNDLSQSQQDRTQLHDQLQDQISRYELSSTNFIAQVADLEKQLARATDTEKRLVEELAATKSEHDRLCQLTATHEQELLPQREQCAKLTQELLELQSQHVELQQEANKGLAIIAQLKVQISDIQSKNDAKEVLVQQGHEQLEKMRVEISSLQNEIKTINEDRKASSEKLVNIQGEFANARDKHQLAEQQFTQQCEDCQKHLQRQTTITKEKELRIVELEATIAEKNGRLQHLSDSILRAEAQLDLIKDIMLHEQRI